MLVKFSTTVPVSRAAAWAFAANFENIGAWDPGVKASKKVRGVCLLVAYIAGATKSSRAAVCVTQLSAGAAGVGTEYELVTVFKGSESTMKCARARSSQPARLGASVSVPSAWLVVRCC
jgi:hypothetical protein